MDAGTRVSARHRPRHAAAAIAVAPAAAAVLAFILVVASLANAASPIPDGLARARADYRDGARHQFQQAQQDGKQP